jgi:hypothetical protein
MGMGGMGMGGMGTHTNTHSNNNNERVRPPYPVDVTAKDIQALCVKRPELLEHLILQIRNMKLQTERLTDST